MLETWSPWVCLLLKCPSMLNLETNFWFEFLWASVYRNYRLLSSWHKKFQGSLLSGILWTRLSWKGSLRISSSNLLPYQLGRQIGLLRVLPSQVLKICRDGDFITFLGNFFQCLPPSQSKHLRYSQSEFPSVQLVTTTSFHCWPLRASV